VQRQIRASAREMEIDVGSGIRALFSEARAILPSGNIAARRPEDYIHLNPVRAASSGSMGGLRPPVAIATPCSRGGRLLHTGDGNSSKAPLDPARAS